MILAGGRATRMGGGDKGLLPLGGRPILAHVIERLAPQVERLALNANGDPARFAAFGLPVLADSVPGHAGPLAGVLAGLDWAAAEGAEAIVTAAADTPFFPRDLVARAAAAAAAAGTPLAMATTPGAEGRRPPPDLRPLAGRAARRSARGARRRDCARSSPGPSRTAAPARVFPDAAKPSSTSTRPTTSAGAEAMLEAGRA